MFPFMREEFGELDEMDRLFVTVCESVVKPEAFEYAKWKGIGRPTTSRTAVFKAFLFKALYDIPTTKELARRLRRDVRARRLCGWNSTGDVPSEGQFSVVNKEFAERGFAEAIREVSAEEGNVPVIDVNSHRGEHRHMTDTEREVYSDRSTDERFFSHLLDSHGGRHVRVRTPKKVSQHLMYGVLVIAVEQMLRMLC